MGIAPRSVTSGLEQRIGACPVADGAVAVGADAFDLGMKRRDAGVEFGDRQRIEILAAKLVEEIVAVARQVIVGIHDANVDPATRYVNKAA